jgi:hypothetical protein
MFLRIISVVEGHGETFALPLLLRRMASEVRPEHWIHAPHPFRVPRDKFLKKGQLERYFQAAAAQAANGGVLILMDSEDPVAGCPANLGPEIRRRALAVRVDVPLLVVIAKNEYESWFLAAAESLEGKRRLRMELTAPADPEAIRGAKEWLEERMVDDSR